jgi:hypothetical protein
VCTGSNDLYLKMWGINGRPYGRLVQSVPVGEKNPDWDLGLDVGKRLKKEDAVLSKVEMQVSQPDRSQISEGLRERIASLASA